MIGPFAISRLPGIVFGAGSISRLPEILKGFGSTFLVVTGGESFQAGPYGRKLFDTLSIKGYNVFRAKIHREPSPSDIDEIVVQYSGKPIDAVIGIGGGSVIDAAKAVSAMLKLKAPVKDYIEGVGDKTHPGIKLPFIAVPTTAGTGSETTENAVLSEVGENGFKRSLRHPALMPDIALVDPELTLGCPPGITAASGMDALTQSLEAFLSVKANTYTDSLAPEAIKLLIENLPLTVQNPGNLDARTAVAYGAMISGILLANAGLGLVHGFASSVGCLIEIPHGVLCGTLIGAANRYILKKLLSGDGNSRYIMKYALLERMINPAGPVDDAEAAKLFVARLEQLADELHLPKLGGYGLTINKIEMIADQTGQKNNPVVLDKEELKNVLISRL
ncbi:MAG: iron-containing alcohol dehydrogenase [Bacteroidales bacterium]|nr:iron-containing alcohol dehydrogenase [Bacteroidales bacterium]